MISAVKRLRSVGLLAAVACFSSGAAWAADITVLCSQGLRAVVEELAPQFEARTGDHLVVTYDTSAQLKSQIEAGKPFDVVVVTPPLMTALVQQGRVVGRSASMLARTEIGLAVKKGAPRPDIATAEALKHTLTSARSVAYSASGESGRMFSYALQKLGIADAVKAKAKAVPNGRAGEVVARGEADLAAQSMPELMSVSGLDVVGPFPADLQSYAVLAGGISTSATDGTRAKAFLTFLEEPSSAAVMRQKGSEPADL
ncbi:molybdate ABC transporter substrate-binding protein [Methylobacterium sp. P31]